MGKKLKVMVKCPRCNGRGFRIYNSLTREIVLCRLCRGHQEIDWVERVVGSRKKMVVPRLLTGESAIGFKVRVEEEGDYMDWRFQ